MRQQYASRCKRGASMMAVPADHLAGGGIYGKAGSLGEQQTTAKP